MAQNLKVNLSNNIFEYDTTISIGTTGINGILDLKSTNGQSHTFTTDNTNRLIFGNFDYMWLEGVVTGINLDLDGTDNAVLRATNANSGFGFDGIQEPSLVVGGVHIAKANTTGLVVSGELTSNNSFGEMYDPSTVISTATTGKYYALLGWTAGLTNNATADVVDSMMIIDQAGIYKGDFSMSLTHSGTAVVVHVCPFVRDGAGAWTELTNGETEATKATGGSVSNLGGTWLMQLSAGDTLGIRAKTDKTGNLTINHGNFNVTRIK